MPRFFFTTAAVAFVGACQCLVPVSDDAGAGFDGGTGGGGLGGGLGTAGGGGGSPECMRASDCPAIDAGLSHCTGASASCLLGRCVLECRGGRQCYSAFEGPCVHCQPPASAERFCPTCMPTPACTFRFEDDCPGTRFQRGSAWRLSPLDAGCVYDLRPVDGGPSAGLWFYGQNFERFGRIDELGGQCSMQSLFTGAPRAALQCPACSAVTLGCD